MRSWMKWLGVGGIIVGIALRISMAGERPMDRRPSAAASKTNRPGRLEFFSRGGATDEQSDAPSDPVADELTADVAAPPKRFVRSKTEPTELGPTKKSLQGNANSEWLPEDTAVTTSTKSTTKSSPTSANRAASQRAELRPTSRMNKAPLRPVADNVEFLAAPEDVEPADAAPITRKLIAKKPSSNIQPTGFDAKAFSTAKRGSSDLTDNGEEEATEGVIPADFQQKTTDKSKIQPVRAEREQISPAIDSEEPAALTPATKPSRVSIVNDRSPKPLTASINRATRPTTTMDRAASGKTSATTGTPSVSVEWVKRGGINVGQECACDLLVKNTGKVSARQVVVEAIFPASVRLTHADPQPAEVSDHLEWSIPELAAGDEKTIHITMIPSQRGELATTANVRFTGTAASVFKVEEPLLKIAVEAPAEVIVGDPLVQTITVTNPGTGTAQNVKIRVSTPDGLEATRGDRSQIDIGALSPGESRTVRLSFTAIAGGEQTLEVEATADVGLKQAAEATVNVIAPALNIAVEGPGLRYVGRDARYTLTITNEGKAATNNVRVTHRIPKGFTFVKADKGGTLDANSVNWFLGHLEPGQSAQVKVQLHANEQGQFEHLVAATSEHGLTAKANATTKVEGSASLVMEIQDLDDPVEVGQETAYEVRISNTGSKAAQNVGLTFELPNGLQLIKVQAATQHLAKNGLILFNDLPELAPGKTALFRIHVRGESEGNQRVRARLTSESIDQELISEELTKFYAE